MKGLRNPCAQLDGLQQGLMAATLDKDAAGNLIRKAGIMGIVIAGGEVKPGDAIRVELPDGHLSRCAGLNLSFPAERHASVATGGTQRIDSRGPVTPLPSLHATRREEGRG